MKNTYKQDTVAYKKTTLKDNYMKFPANAIAVGKVGANKGKLLLACGMLNRITIMDPDSGHVIREYGEEYGTTGGTDDVSEGPDGTLYFTQFWPGKVGWIRPDGTHGDIPTKTWTNSIAVSHDGKWLYYGVCIGDDQLWRIELQNGLPKKGAKHELVEQSPGWANSMDPSADGYIYSPTNMYGEIRRINPETKEITVLYNNTEFPSSCEINDATGMIYVTEFHLGYITRIDTKIKDPQKAKRIIAKAPPGTDNVACMDGPNPRIFGSSFLEDWIFEAYENGDPQRIITQGGMLPHQIHVIKGANGDRIFIKDPGRVREWFPAENRYNTLAHGEFWNYIEDKAFERGVPRINPNKPVTWTASFNDYLSMPFGKVMQPTAEGHLLCGGNLGDTPGTRLVLFDFNNRKALRTVKDLDGIQDAIMVGKDIYMMESKEKEWPVTPRIIRITPDDKRETVFKGKDFVAFARTDDVAFAGDMGTGTIYQVVKGGKWLQKPSVLVSGLKGPQGMTITNDGNLLVMEINEGTNGRMLKVNLKTKGITILAENLVVDRTLDKRSWNILRPHSVVAQASDGAIYFTEPGATSFSVLRAQQ
jgi:sugar lactone lactonase YvrE